MNDDGLDPGRWRKSGVSRSAPQAWEASKPPAPDDRIGRGQDAIAHKERRVVRALPWACVQDNDAGVGSSEDASGSPARIVSNRLRPPARSAKREAGRLADDEMWSDDASTGGRSTC